MIGRVIGVGINIKDKYPKRTRVQKQTQKNTVSNPHIPH